VGGWVGGEAFLKSFATHPALFVILRFIGQGYNGLDGFWDNQVHQVLQLK